MKICSICGHYLNYYSQIDLYHCIMCDGFREPRNKMYYILTGIGSMVIGSVGTIAFLLAISPWVKKQSKKGANSIQDVGEQVNATLIDKEGVKHNVN